MYPLKMNDHTRGCVQPAQGSSSDQLIAEAECQVATTSTTPEWSEDSPEVEEMTEGEKKALHEWEEGRKDQEIEAEAKQRDSGAEQKQRVWEQAIQHEERDEATRRWERAKAEEQNLREKEAARSVAGAVLPQTMAPSPMSAHRAAGALRDWTRVTSCELCRIRKLKCDRVIGGCSNCRTRKEICSYTGHPPTEHVETVGLSAVERNRQEIQRLRSHMSSLTAKLRISEQDAVNIRLEAERRYSVHVARRTRPPDPLAPPPLVTLRRTGQPKSGPPRPFVPQSIPHSMQHLLHPSPNAPHRAYYAQAAFGTQNPSLAPSHTHQHAPPLPPPQQFHSPSNGYYSTSYASLVVRPGVPPRQSPPPALAPRQVPSAPIKVDPPPLPLRPVVRRKDSLPSPLYPQPDPENVIHRRGSDATIEVLYAGAESSERRSPLLQPKSEPLDMTLSSLFAFEKEQKDQSSTSSSRIPSRPLVQHSEKRPRSPGVANSQPPALLSPNITVSRQPLTSNFISQYYPGPSLGRASLVAPQPKRRKRSNSAPAEISHFGSR